MLTQKELASLLREYHAAKVAAAKADELGKQIKSYLAESGANQVFAGGYTATVTTFTTSRLDSAALKRDNPALVDQYTVKAQQSRLTIK